MSETMRISVNKSVYKPKIEPYLKISQTLYRSVNIHSSLLL